MIELDYSVEAMRNNEPKWISTKDIMVHYKGMNVIIVCLWASINYVESTESKIKNAALIFTSKSCWSIVCQ